MCTWSSSQYFHIPLSVKQSRFLCLIDSLRDSLWISFSNQDLCIVPLPWWLGAMWIVPTSCEVPDRALDLMSLDLKVNYVKSHLTQGQAAWHMGRESLFDRRQSFHDYACIVPICTLSNSGRDVDSRWWIACTVGHMKFLYWEPDIKHVTLRPNPCVHRSSLVTRICQTRQGSSEDCEALRWKWLTVSGLLTSCLCALGSTP